MHWILGLVLVCEVFLLQSAIPCAEPDTLSIAVTELVTFREDRRQSRGQSGSKLQSISKVLTFSQNEESNDFLPLHCSSLFLFEFQHHFRLLGR